MGLILTKFQGIMPKFTFEKILTVISKTEQVETTADLISEEGYPVETHEVTTDDGYLLTVHR